MADQQFLASFRSSTNAERGGCPRRTTPKGEPVTYATLPLTEDPWQVFTLDLTINGEPFHAQVEIRYLPAPDQWFLSIWDHASGEMLINQIPVICSYELVNDLLVPFRYLRDGAGLGSLYGQGAMSLDFAGLWET